MPDVIATRLNAELTEGNESGMFVTMFIGLLDLQTGHLDFCNAGHNPPVIGGGDHQGAFLDVKSNSFSTKNEKNESEFKIILYFCKQNVVFVHEVQSSGLTKHLQLTIVRQKSSNLV